jgi:hypothetical protein
VHGLVAKQQRTGLVIKIGAVLIAAALLAVFALWPAKTRLATAAGALQCRHLYAIAHTRSETLAVDQTPPFEWTNGDDNPLRCGELRGRGLLDTTAIQRSSPDP